ALKTWRLGLVGFARLTRFSTLKISTRSWTLNSSAARLIRLFLKIERSRFDRPGPMRVLRPPFPSRGPGDGDAKHPVLMECLASRGFTADSQPGPVSRSGKANVSALLRPSGSPPMIAAKGRPELAW